VIRTAPHSWPGDSDNNTRKQAIMQQCDTLIVAGWVLPVDATDQPLENHALAVSDGRIIDLLPAGDAMQAYAPGALIERPGHVLIPGLVNTHTHAAMILFRGFGDDLPLERWLKERIWPAEQRSVSAEMVRDGTRHAIAEMLLSGTTCFSDQYFFPEVVAETADALSMRAVVATPVIDFPTAWASGAEECLSKGAELVHDRYADHPLISGAFAPHSTAVVSDESFRKLRVLCDQLDSRIQIHLHESAQEVADEVSSSGKRPFERLRDLDMLNGTLMLVHAVHLNDAEIALCAERGVAVAHCPRSNLKLASGMARVQALQQAGIIVGLGTDGAASNNELDMLGELRTAALLAKAVANDAGALPAAAALRMATIDGARALGLDGEIGSLEAGKWADVTCIDLQTLNSQPLYDPASQLVYTAHPSQVSDVWVAGRHLLEQGRLLHIDVDDVFKRSAEWQQRIAASSQPQ
jgi:5-methylthioadenosine/S-adenosylhomocysteine deaminase